MERQARSVVVAKRLSELEAKVGPLEEHILASRLLDRQRLKPNRDIFGSWTEVNPFFFRRDLWYYDAFYRYLEQERIEVLARQTVKLETGLGDRIEAADGSKLFFLWKISDQTTGSELGSRGQ